MMSIGYADSAVSAQTQESQTAENIQEELDFLYIESKELEAPGTQNIAVSWNESIKNADKLELVYADAGGKEYNVQEKERTDSSILFSETFDVKKTGTYIIKGINYVVGDTTGFFAFNSQEIKATFTVVDKMTDAPVTDNIVAAEQTGSKINSDDIEDQITDTLAAANVPVATDASSSGKKVIVLDPGHGSNEAGSSGNGLKEYQLNYKIAQYCKAELETYDGVEIYLTHNGTGFTGTASERLQKRVDFASSKNADVLVSLHINATGTGTAQGAEVWYPNNNYKPAANTVGKALAQDILDELVKLGLYDRGIKEKSTVEDKYPDGSLQDWYGIIRLSKMAGIPGIIVEHAFIDNSSDVSKFLSSDTKLKALGVADATGIANYFGLTKKSTDTDPDQPTFGWVTDNKGTKYLYKDGTCATGYVAIEGSYYYFNESGFMQKYDQKINGVPYYFGSNGKAASKGWVTTNAGARKYSLGNGKLATGYVKIGNYYYGFNSAGVMQKGNVTLNSKRYVFASSGIATLYTTKTKANLNYRTGPSTGYAKKGTLKKGTVVSITRTQNGWGQMTNGYWIKLSYTSRVTTYPQNISSSGSKVTSSTYKVKLTANLNYRTGPSTKYARKGTYKKGKIVTIKKTQSGWGQMTNGYWIKLSYTKRA